MFVGSATTEEIREFLAPYGAIVDYPAAIYTEQLYKAFPDAKFMLVGVF